MTTAHRQHRGGLTERCPQTKSDQSKMLGINVGCGNLRFVLDAKSDRATLVLMAHFDHPFVIGIKNRRAVRFETFNQFCLCSCDVLDAAEILEMDRSNYQFHSYVGWSDPTQTLNFVRR